MLTRWWWRFVRFGFRLLYNQLAFTYDWVSQVVSLGAWRCWQRASLKHLAVPPGSLVLELAHGTGNLQLDLADAGYCVVGLDLSPYMGHIARTKLRRHCLPVRLVRGRAQQLPYTTGAFAAVIVTFPTDFLLAPDTLREVYRVLQPGGQLVVVPSAVLVGGGVVAAVLEWLYRVTGQRGRHRGDLGAFLRGFGFDAQIVREHCPRSIASVVIANKMG